jgi:hypothetical protein
MLTDEIQMYKYTELMCSMFFASKKRKESKLVYAMTLEPHLIKIPLNCPYLVVATRSYK